MGYRLVHGFEHAGDQEVVLEFYYDGLVCEGFEDREDQLPVTRLGLRNSCRIATETYHRGGCGTGGLDHFSEFSA